MTAQTAGLVLTVFAILMTAFIYWGGFVEEKRAKADTEAARR